MTESGASSLELTDQEIGDLLSKAVTRLAAMAPGVSILLPEPEESQHALTGISPSGWCQIGVLRDARNRFWYRVLWHPESATGRLLREKPKAKRDAMGRCLPAQPTEK